MESIHGIMWTNNDPHPEELFREVFDRSLLGQKSTLKITRRDENCLVDICVVDRTHIGQATVFMMFAAFCNRLTQENIRYKITFGTTWEN